MKPQLPTVYIPQDSGALSMGADKVAEAIQQEAERRGAAVQIVRNGSRGMYWLEPLVEVSTSSGRTAYGPVRSGDVTALFDAGFLNGGQHNRYAAPIRPGDVISVTRRFVDVVERETKRGPMVFFTSELRWDNQDGALVRLGEQTSIYY